MYLARIVISGLMLMDPPVQPDQPYRLILPTTPDAACDAEIPRHELTIDYRGEKDTQGRLDLPQDFFVASFSWKEGLNQTAPETTNGADRKPFPSSPAEQESTRRIVSLGEVLGEGSVQIPAICTQTDESACARRAMIDLKDGTMTPLWYVAKGRPTGSGKALTVQVGGVHRAIAEVGLVRTRTVEEGSTFQVDVGDGDPLEIVASKDTFRPCGAGDRCLDFWIRYSPPAACDLADLPDNPERTPGRHFRLLYPLIDRDCASQDSPIPQIPLGHQEKGLNLVENHLGSKAVNLRFPRRDEADGSEAIHFDGRVGIRRVLNPPICPYAQP